jgi:hypothetical protein
MKFVVVDAWFSSRPLRWLGTVRCTSRVFCRNWDEFSRQTARWRPVSYDVISLFGFRDGSVVGLL